MSAACKAAFRHEGIQFAIYDTNGKVEGESSAAFPEIPHM